MKVLFSYLSWTSWLKAADEEVFTFMCAEGAPDPGWISMFRRDKERRKGFTGQISYLLLLKVYQQEGPPRWQGSMAGLKGRIA